ncbi:MAG TPA: FAD-dependent oxidoreductase [Candidatus Binatia bacterium]|jgi:malate dehydrogenase (quinone)|nr:FAD-dependent oxidoreductase [Candidatus Binatia bacterium]
MASSERRYDVVIIGAGVTGTALLYVLSKYGDVRRVAVVEKEAAAAQVSSKATNNSQTLHCGDIETNYTAEKAAKVKAAADMLVRYVTRLAPERGIYKKAPKMVLGVGEAEVRELDARFKTLGALFPKLRQVGPDELRELEPAVMEGRRKDERVTAHYTEEGYVMNFEKLAGSFVEDAKALNPDGIDLLFGTTVASIAKEDGGWRIETSGGTLKADAIVVAAGAYSLLMAHRMGFGLEYTLLPVAGDFYTAPNRLRGKVYTVQKKGLPFAAVHGDPDITDPKQMRFGPIAKALPLLEPRKWSTAPDFFKVLRFDMDTLASIIEVNKDPVVLGFIARNLLYYIPFVGNRLFVGEARKIIPAIEAKDLTYGHGLGGIRPQVVHKKKRLLQMGEAKISAPGIIFNITPSPGATVCLHNAVEDARALMGFFGGRRSLDEDALRRDLLG